ncbi:hypothetical protein DXG03_006348 [Asterophora parasitica]|uniref:Uncharacterized protein n=1 Tax=Asterophora parasitica TaxID=117018 RepID=A0A9P7G9R6_9AGAR|nr:hypothetical protein DXG03_006348 [Asterophora parasitica]
MAWGPPFDAFPFEERIEDQEPFVPSFCDMNTPRPIRVPSSYLTPNPTFITPRVPASQPAPNRFTTPIRPSGIPAHATVTIQRTSTIRRTGERRAVSDREAMKQLVDCIGMSARKKVLESGRKPRILTITRSRSGSESLIRKELRFDASAAPVTRLVSTSADVLKLGLQARVAKVPHPILVNTQRQRHHHQRAADGQVWSGSEDTDSEGPPSPSPTPRPGSAMSTLSRRSGTPTVGSMRMGMMGTTSSTSTMLLGIPRSMSGRSLSFSRSVDFSTVSFRSSLMVEEREEQQEDDRDVHVKTSEEMESRLTAMLRDIRGIEERLAKVAQMIR